MFLNFYQFCSFARKVMLREGILSRKVVAVLFLIVVLLRSITA